MTSRERPAVPIIAVTPHRGTARRLCLSWGISCVMEPEIINRFKLAVLAAVRAVRTLEIAEPYDQIVITAGVPFNVPGTTNILRVAPCSEKLIYPADP